MFIIGTRTSTQFLVNDAVRKGYSITPYNLGLILEINV